MQGSAQRVWLCGQGRLLHGVDAPAGSCGLIGKLQAVAQLCILAPVLDEHARNEHALGHRALAGTGDLEALARVFREAVQIQAVVPVRAANERQAVGAKMGAGKAKSAAQVFHTFNKIVLPIMKPALAVQAIFSFVASWNNYFIPALVLDSADKKTLPILIAQLRSADFLKFDMGKVYMMVAIAILPVIIVYLLLSKFIVRGVALGGVKG